VTLRWMHQQQTATSQTSCWQWQATPKSSRSISSAWQQRQQQQPAAAYPSMPLPVQQWGLMLSCKAALVPRQRSHM
jgi:hypothetical protein